MSEESAIDRTASQPATVDSLVADLAALGVQPGMTLLVHSSLSAVGWVCGGSAAVVLALEKALGPDGTLVMPTHSSDLSDPSHWENPPVPEAWWPLIREHTPAFEPGLSQTRQMGAIVDCFRGQTGAVRSYHPQASFAARGPQAETITKDHSLAFGLGEGSPLARVYDLDGYVLLLGVGHANNTSLHLAEHRANYAGKRQRREGGPIFVDGRRRWVEFDDLDTNDDDFPALGVAFAGEAGVQLTGKVAEGTALLMSQRALVDYAIGWMEANRTGETPASPGL